MSELLSPSIPPEWMGSIQDHLSYDQYRSLDGINAHGLMDVLQSPGTYRQSRSLPRAVPSPSMLLGMHFETALLEPEYFAKFARIGPVSSCPEGYMAVTSANMSKIESMLAATKANPHAKQALTNVQVQPVAFWQDERHQVPCKARLDAIATFDGGQRIAVDIKTARAASAADFSRAAAQFRYDLQAAHYLEAGKATGAFSADVFLFIVVQNTAPYSCFVYEAGERMLARGRAWREHAMGLYAQCCRTNDWPNEPAFQTLELPKWAPWPEQGSSDPSLADDGLSDPPDLD